MNTLKNRMIATGLAAALVISAGAVWAGNSDRMGPARQGERLSYIFTQLQLTEAQQTDVLSVLETLHEEHRQTMWTQMQSLREQDERPSREQMLALHESMQSAHVQDLTDQLNTVLSPDVTAQLVEYLSFHQPMMPGAGGMRGMHSGARDGGFKQGFGRMGN